MDSQGQLWANLVSGVRKFVTNSLMFCFPFSVPILNDGHSRLRTVREEAENSKTASIRLKDRYG